MKVNIGTFKKRDGTLRTMKFVKINDLPSLFLESKLKGGKQHNTHPGEEIVWDLEKGNFRVFSWNSLVGEVETFEQNTVI